MKGGEKALHVQRHHPEYAFTFGKPGSFGYSMYYWCSTCHKTCSGVAGIVRHYRDCHPEKIGAPRKLPERASEKRYFLTPNSKLVRAVFGEDGRYDRSGDAALAAVMLYLTETERQVLDLHFGLKDGQARTLGEVGREFALSRERMRQIENKALRKLRHPSRSKILPPYFRQVSHANSS